MTPYLAETQILDITHPDVLAFAGETLDGTETTPREQAVKLYYAVRDRIWYFPYVPFHRPEDYRASGVIARKRGFCIAKASLLCALGRSVKIPSRVGLADVRNHLTSPGLRELMGSDVFACHGYVEFHLEGKWVKCTPAFNIELCQKNRVSPLEFNGRENSLFQPMDSQNNQFMEYLQDHGTFTDIPVDYIVKHWKKIYGEERVHAWMTRFENLIL